MWDIRKYSNEGRPRSKTDMFTSSFVQIGQLVPEFQSWSSGHGVRSNLLSVCAENECLVTDITDRTVATERLPPTSAEDAVI